MVREEARTTGTVNNLPTKFFGQKAIYYPSLTSTMDIARKESQHGATEGTIIMAGEQSMGRGRKGRAWLSPKGNIAFSIILHPKIEFLPFLVIISALAVARGIEKVTNLTTQIKWPNDILIGQKKAGGILIENELKKNKVLYSIVGIGINANVNPADKNYNTFTATCIRDELGVSMTRTSIIKYILTEMEAMYLGLPDHTDIVNEWRDRLITLGRKVSVDYSGHTLEGVAESVTGEGALVLRHEDGNSTVIAAGDVVPVE